MRMLFVVSNIYKRIRCSIHMSGNEHEAKRHKNCKRGKHRIGKIINIYASKEFLESFTFTQSIT